MKNRETTAYVAHMWEITAPI